MVTKVHIPILSYLTYNRTINNRPSLSESSRGKRNTVMDTRRFIKAVRNTVIGILIGLFAIVCLVTADLLDKLMTGRTTVAEIEFYTARAADDVCARFVEFTPSIDNTTRFAVFVAILIVLVYVIWKVVDGIMQGWESARNSRNPESVSARPTAQWNEDPEGRETFITPESENFEVK